MIRLALPASVGAILAIAVTWDAGIVAMVTSAPLAASLLALAFVLLFSSRGPGPAGDTQEKAESVRIYLAASELSELDRWRQSHGKNLTRPEAARMLLLKPLLGHDGQAK